MNSFKGLNALQKDALIEMMNIGTGNAATALAELLGEQTHVQIPELCLCDFNDAADYLGGPEKIISCVMSQMEGDISGMILFFQDLSFINGVLSKMLGETVEDYQEICGIQESALIEVGNIIISSYVTALSGVCSLAINLSVPSHCVSMAGAIVMVPVVQLISTSDQIMMLDGNLSCEDEQGSSKLMLVPDMKSLDIILQRLGVVGG